MWKYNSVYQLDQMLIQIVRIAVINIIKATTPAKEPVSCQRFSLDLEEDLQTLLEARAAPRVANVDQHESNVAVSGNAMNKIFEMEDENKSNNANTIKRIPYNFSTKASCDETILECQQQRTSDESCMGLEKMCDKTASDPDSTLFKYIHSENKDMAKEDAKKRSADGNYIKIPYKQVPFPYWMVNMAFAFSPSITVTRWKKSMRVNRNISWSSVSSIAL
ncbi:uncharacterized protein [Eurosta solidaginis]|uniref:uncharacterized protein isoform X3 n=1 Tax=Eurosta solidaginis TaxID=178769 RepID=UPI0035309B0C